MKLVLRHDLAEPRHLDDLIWTVYNVLLVARPFLFSPLFKGNKQTNEPKMLQLANYLVIDHFAFAHSLRLAHYKQIYVSNIHSDAVYTHTDTHTEGRKAAGCSGGCDQYAKQRYNGTRPENDSAAVAY